MAFIEWELPSTNRRFKVVEQDEISLTRHKNGRGFSYHILVNPVVSQLATDKGFNKLLIRQDDITGEIGLEINATKGLPFTKQYSRSNSASVTSIEWVTKLCRLLDINLDNGRQRIRISKNLSNSEKCLFYRIVKVIR